GLTGGAVGDGPAVLPQPHQPAADVAEHAGRGDLTGGGAESELHARPPHLAGPVLRRLAPTGQARPQAVGQEAPPAARARRLRAPRASPAPSSAGSPRRVRRASGRWDRKLPGVPGAAASAPSRS